LVNFKETKVKILPHDFSTSNNVSNGTSIFILLYPKNGTANQKNLISLKPFIIISAGAIK
jgi:hypothetical protein